MTNIPNKFIIFGAIAAAALVIPGMVGPIMFQEAQAVKNVGNQEHSQNQGAAGLVAANVGLQTGDVCVQAINANSDNC